MLDTRMRMRYISLAGQTDLAQVKWSTGLQWLHSA